MWKCYKEGLFNGISYKCMVGTLCRQKRNWKFERIEEEEKKVEKEKCSFRISKIWKYE